MKRRRLSVAGKVGAAILGAVTSAIAVLLPKKRGLVAFCPRFMDGRDGNVKHLFLHVVSRSPDLTPIFVTENPRLHAECVGLGLPVAQYPGFRAAWKLLRAQVTVFESEDQRGISMVRPLTRGSRSIQLWHGNGMKTVSRLRPEFTYERGQGLLATISHATKSLHRWLMETHRHYAVVCFTSVSQLETRGAAFSFDEALIIGQPRNDVLFDESPHERLGMDTRAFRRIQDGIREGLRILLYAPTYRSADAPPLHQAWDFARLDEFLRREGLLMLVKLHAKQEGADFPESANVVVHDGGCDVYPIMRHADLMVTDYSSIYMDFILQDKPVVFYVFDLDEYVCTRKLVHEFSDVAPGPRCRDQQELEAAISKLLDDGDEYWAHAREKVVTRFNASRDGRASERITRYIEEELVGR